MSWSSSDRKDRLPSDWQRRRRRVLARDKGVCQLAYPDICLGVASEVDHIQNNDDHSYSNLQAVCLLCHRKKTQREAANAKKQYSQKRERKHPGLR